MSIFYASFQKARSGMLTNVCEIEKTVELTDEEYERFSQNLTVPHEMLARESERFRTDKHGIARCLLVMAENRQDGILALTEGSDRAMYTAHLPNARKFLKMEQSLALSEFVDRIHSTVGDYAKRAVDGQVEGEFRMPLSAFHDASENAAYIDDLFLEMLSERPEVAHVEEDIETREIFVTLAPDYVRTEDNVELRELTQRDVDIMCAKHLLWLHGAEGEQADFSNCLLRDLNLSNRNLESAVFDGAKLVNTPLYASNISYSSFSGTRFYRCELSRMKAENAMFPDAFFHSCEITTTAYVECNFSRATFSESNVGGSMHQCCIDGTNFGNEANGRPDLIQCSDDEESWAEDMHCSPSVSM